MDTIAPVRADRQHHMRGSVMERVVNRTLYTSITSESAHSNARVVIRVDRVPVTKSHPTELALCQRIRCSAPVALLIHCVLLQDVVDLSWSASHFLLSASVDCTVRLWHISETQCLRVFR